MPDGEIIERADCRYYESLSEVTNIAIQTDDTDYISDMKCNTVEDDLTDAVTGADIRFYNGSTELTDRNALGTSLNKITVDLNTPLYSYDTLEDKIEITDYEGNTVAPSSTDYTNGIYTMEFASAFANSAYTIAVGDNSFEFSTAVKSTSSATGSLPETDVYNLVTSFNGDAKTGRGFAWTASSGYTNMVVRYAPSNDTGNTKDVKATYTAYGDLLYYKADVSGLEAGTEYIYRIGDTSLNLWSADYSFTTEAEDENEFSFIGFTDPQSGSWSGGFEYYKQTLDTAMIDAPDAAFMVNLGDLVDNGEDAAQWTNYFKAVKGYSESLPHMAVLGNHETRGDEVTAGKYFSLHFNHPDNGNGCLGELNESWVVQSYSKGVVTNISDTVYSFDYGDVHFAVLNTGSDFYKNDAYAILKKQKLWLKADMEASDAKWKIVMLHQGLYPAKTERWNTQLIEDVLDECDIDLVLQGHDHIVTRTYPMYNGEIVTKKNTNNVTKGTGTVHLILGSAGPKRYDVVEATPKYSAVLNATPKKIPSYSVFNVKENSIEVITKQINGMVVDKFVISE